MLEMRPRTKVVADFQKALLSPADIICIFAQDVASHDHNLTHVWWKDSDKKTKRDVVKSLLTCMATGDISLWYPHATSTRFDFGSVSDTFAWYEDGHQMLRYRVEAHVNKKDSTKIDVTLFSWESHDAIYNKIASTTLGFEYFDDMGTLHYAGSDDDWDKVED